jgi:hypothetical protein
MNNTYLIDLPNPDFIKSQIASIEDELKAMRRLLRASCAAAKAAEARQNRGVSPVLKEGGTRNGS